MGDALLYYGAILVNLKPAYRAWELDYVVRQVGMRQLVSAVAHRTSDYRAMVAETGYGQAVFIGEPGWGELVAVGRRADPAALRERAAALTFDDPINRGVPLHPPRRRRRPGVGAPDLKCGEELMAWIVIRPGAEPLTAGRSGNSAPAAWRTTRSPGTST
jgi:acyl-CoA synthetase (AMP-forming)/AMP-acid ligase II